MRSHALPFGTLLIILLKLALRMPPRISPPALVYMRAEMVQSVHLLSPDADALQPMYVTVTFTLRLCAGGRGGIWIAVYLNNPPGECFAAWLSTARQ